ncbi:helix-turn-helix domain-containing protein [Streptomyces luteireticuli]|uniref:nSTAND1 domain-containing NTPase n=1 Tax=Streptomyces luteireticuli TaxID=173858 RepID=UPI003557D1E7
MAGSDQGPGGTGVGDPFPERPQAGDLLRRLRRERGMSLTQLSRAAFYSKGYLSKVENGEKPLTQELARACDQALQSDGTLERLVSTPVGKGRYPRPQYEGKCPYQGLAPFGTKDARWFFGRDDAIAGIVTELTQRIRTTGPLLVMAPSGAGKSSVLRAGLLPALARGVLPVDDSHTWPVVLLTPGEHPVEELLIQMAVATGGSLQLLRKALDEGPESLSAAIRAATDSKSAESSSASLIIVDQFEETFTLCRDERERTVFVEALLALASGRGDDGSGIPSALVVLGIRADFYDRCLTYPGLAASSQRGHIALGPMNDAQLREVITAPARECGLEVEAGLVEVLLRDAGLGPNGTPEFGTPCSGALPLLSHALLSTWQHRENAKLTVAGYELTGGISGAVAATAERAYTSLSRTQRAVARRVLLQLVHVGTDKVTGHRIRHANLLDSSPAGPVETVLETFTQARLLTMDADHVELAHETLLQAWPRLRQWIDDDRSTLRTRQLLLETAAAWEGEGRDKGLLYRGARLAMAREWAADPHDGTPLTPVARAFLKASDEAERSEKRMEQRRLRQLRVLTSSLATLLVLALVAGAVAVRQNLDAQHQRRLAVSRELAARADSLVKDRPEAAVITALAAYRKSPTDQARSSLLSSYGRYRSRWLTGHTKHVNSVAFSPDGRTLATASADHRVKLWDTATHEVVATLSGHTDVVEGVAFSPDGRTLASVSDDRSVKLWDVATHSPITTLTGHRGPVTTVAFSPDGRTLATAGFDRTVRLWNIAGHRQTASLTGHKDLVHAVAFSPDGRTLASAGADRTALLWDLTTSRAGATLAGHTDTLQGVAFSPDGRTLATTSNDRTVRLWDTSTHRQTATLTGHTGFASGVVFSPDGRAVATGGYDRTARLWDVATHRQLFALDAGAGNDVVTAVAFSPDGRTLATANTGVDFTDLWDVSTHQRIGTLSGRSAPGTVARISPDGQTLATGDTTGTIRLRNLPSLRPITTFSASSAEITGLSFTPDGRSLAVLDDDGTVRIRNTAARSQSVIPKELAGPVNALAYSPDGHTLATANKDGSIRLWDAATLRRTASFTGHKRHIIDIAFSPDSRTLATAGYDGRAKLWDTRTHQEITTFSHLSTVNAVAFSPDGRTLATTSKDRTVGLWEVSTHRKVATLTGHTANVSGASFSPDGRSLATTSSDGTIRLWDTGERRTTAVLSTDTPDRSPVFSPDDHTLVTASGENVSRLWDTDPAAVADQVCLLAKRHRWAEFIPDFPRDMPCT